jgi:hypothetical protein
MSLRRFVLLLGLAGSTSLHAATEFTNGLVPMDVVREFAGGTVIKGLPDGFPALLLPEGLDLQLIGSLERDAWSQTILLRSSLSREAVRERLHAALTVQGWTDLGSTLPIAAQYILNLCHGQHGLMSINTNTASNGSRIQVTRSFHPAQLRTSCSEQQNRNRETATLYSFYSSQMPVLEVPAGTVNTPGPAILRGGSSSFSTDYAEIDRDGSIEVPGTTAAAVHAHFSTQMQAQGWALDSSDTGERSASSVWTRTLTPPGATASADMFVTLTVLRGTGNFYGVRLRLQTPPAGSTGLGIINIGTF